MKPKAASDHLKYYKTPINQIPNISGNRMNTGKTNEQYLYENASCIFENADFDLYYQQNPELEASDDIYFFNDIFNHSFQNENDEKFNPNKSLNCPKDILLPSNNKNDHLEKNIGLKIIDNKSNQSQSFQFPFLDDQCSQNFLKGSQIFNSNLQSYSDLSQTNFEYNIPIQFETSLLTKKMRKRRGTGDEAQKKHPNDDFKFENKPSYHFLVSISNEFFRSKCTFEIINKVANIIEQLNPKIPKRTRMERRRKSVQLCWFHNNWLRINKMKEKIIEQLSMDESQNQMILKH